MFYQFGEPPYFLSYLPHPILHNPPHDNTGITGYLYTSPSPISKWTYIAFAVASVFTFTWLFAFDKGQLWVALVILFLTTFSLYVTMFFSLKNLADVTPELKYVYCILHLH